MAEICLDCWNEINNTNYTKWDYNLSKEPCLCEECGDVKEGYKLEMGDQTLYLCKECIEELCVKLFDILSDVDIHQVA